MTTSPTTTRLHADTGSFRLLLASRAASNLSDGLAIGMLPLLVADVTRSPLLIAIGSVALYVPWLLVGPVAGLIVDRRGRPSTILRSDAARAVIFAALAVAVLTDPGSAIWLVPVVAVATGSLEVLADSSATAHVPHLAGDDLERANGRLAGAELIMNALVGPALGALLFTVQPALPVLAQAGLMAISAGLVMRLERTPAPERPDGDALQSVVAEVIAGARSIVASSTLRLIVPATGLLGFAFGMSVGVLVLHLAQNTNVGEAGYGLVWTVAAIGGTAAAFLLTGLPDRVGGSTVLVGSAVVISASLLMVSDLTSGWLIAAAFALVSIGQELWNVVSVSHRQRVTPDHLQGRVSAAARMAASGALPLGGIAAGLLAERVAVGAVISVAGFVAAAAALVVAPIVGRLGENGRTGS